ncbi:hypothetical protein Pyn_35235 [Prunus yedoensis var. nudiflora]|uniref:Uncharacterized protein n=1 Tax=Prunus yedoensis var. nudiflora TaxID=2094558 RepID=A0A314Z4H8_PRUYE|nr:hypothetical protein Pyn_35235 [Prunus yedoensis var. nudiflora]
MVVGDPGTSRSEEVEGRQVMDVPTPTNMSVLEHVMALALEQKCRCLSGRAGICCSVPGARADVANPARILGVLG